ncbi:type-F conjugative transfer system pilin assembly protein TrbC [Pukyongiella litopenaei]|uniref:Type-F conjugative transfer system pilin assembly protein TrbC n=1 Tax=Pukyongiella litopenaei TaxID=2605946 RepID=A0A5C2H3F0_9RHOB|nr:type-F conjugative transfer system pilin assembly protein TrbC [Pukyongiella litopenaei]QEP30426.1 type-F conjugative transfer system pilin assembly protein TrbC [Pukyongiella litopenaei]
MLRVVTVFTLALAPVAGLADQAASRGDAVVEYAPGSTGRITAPLATIVDEAERHGEILRERLGEPEPAEGAFDGVDFDALRDRALNDPRVRALLGTDDDVAGAAEAGTRYEDSKVFLLASFSMPRESLRQMMSEARDFGLNIVFRGFVNNSVHDTQAALEKTFGDLDAAAGFSIDPTLFTRFHVEAVPQVIAVGDAMEVCETEGCAGDPVPPHDRVRGNVPLRFALERIAAMGEVGAAEARRLLRGR